MIKLSLLRGYPGLSGWVQSNHRHPYKREQEGALPDLTLCIYLFCSCGTIVIIHARDDSTPRGVVIRDAVSRFFST